MIVDRIYARLLADDSDIKTVEKELLRVKIIAAGLVEHGQI